MTKNAPLSFVGLGSMGFPMAQNLVKAGYNVHGFDVYPPARARFLEAGGKASASAAEASTGASSLILMVVNAAQARDVLFEQGALAAMLPKSLVILMSTCSSADVKAIAEKVEALGHSFLDAPVSGGVTGAIAGSLTIMAAASDAVYARALPILEVLGQKLYHVGREVGQGAAVKTINQLLCGVHIAAAAEALMLGQKAGVDGAMLLEVLSGSAASSWMLKDRGPRMLQEQPQVTSAVDIFVKDLSLVAEVGRNEKAALPLAALALQMFLAASGAGFGKEDDSQVLKAYRALNGLS